MTSNNIDQRAYMRAGRRNADAAKVHNHVGAAPVKQDAAALAASVGHGANRVTRRAYRAQKLSR